MKTITIRLSDVEAAMLAEIARKNIKHRSLHLFLSEEIRAEHAKINR